MHIRANTLQPESFSLLPKRSSSPSVFQLPSVLSSPSVFRLPESSVLPQKLYKLM
jgi:hypothetical protein